LFQNN